MSKFLKRLRKLLFGNSGILKWISMTQVVYNRGDGKKYLLGYEMMHGGDYDIAMSWDDIIEVGKENQRLPESLRNTIAHEVKKELNAQRTKVDFYPPLFDISDSSIDLTISN